MHTQTHTPHTHTHTHTTHTHIHTTHTHTHTQKHTHKHKYTSCRNITKTHIKKYSTSPSHPHQYQGFTLISEVGRITLIYFTKLPLQNTSSVWCVCIRMCACVHGGQSSAKIWMVEIVIEFSFSKSNESPQDSVGMRIDLMVLQNVSSQCDKVSWKKIFGMTDGCCNELSLLPTFFENSD